MYAALITGKETVKLTDFPDPIPAPAGVVVDIAFCGVCGTDIHAYQSGRPYNPAICGHEWSGTISAIGRDVGSLSESFQYFVHVQFLSFGIRRSAPRMTSSAGLRTVAGVPKGVRVATLRRVLRATSC